MVEYLTGEWILTKCKKANGSKVIFARSILTSLIIYIFVLALILILDPYNTYDFSRVGLQKLLIDKITWFGVIFAASYTALYAKFASQWSYLANLYNNIKNAECNSGNEDKISEWKAGFIEDAEVLHLYKKEIFSSVILEWSKDNKVREAFENYTKDGKSRLDNILKEISQFCA